MKKIFKKNHIIITVLALLIAVAGYINYTDNIKDKNKTKSNTANEAGGEILNNDAEPDDNSLTDPGTTVFTSTKISELIISAKLEREQIRATSKETLLEIINNENLQDDAKADAIAQMVAITDASEKEAAAELLLEAKGFTNVIVSISGTQTDVVVEKEELTESELAQIEDVVTRKTGCSVDCLTITSVSPVKNKSAETSQNSDNKEPSGGDEKNDNDNEENTEEK
ncbi:MAG: SpoIIIAH-like family protein [Butyrivibrio sp.]